MVRQRLQQVQPLLYLSTVQVGGTCTNEWDATAIYTGGDQVTHAGKTWEAKWWTQGQDPSKSGEWGVWKEVGPANCN